MTPAEDPAPLRVHEPRAAPVALVFDSPHSGSWFPDDFGHRVSVRDLRAAEDCWIHELYASAPAHGATLLEATFARTYVDANRNESDVDLELIDGEWPHPVAHSGKGSLGKALVWRTLDDGRPIYDRKLRPDEVLHRIEAFLRPYQRTLGSLIEQAHARHGVVYHVNCHSMPSFGGKMSADGTGTRRADIVLGDRDGSTCDAEFTEFVRRFFADAGYEVRVNDPYKGVELVRAFSAPAAGRHSLQVEINRDLYMDEATLEKSANYASVRGDIDRLVAMLAAFARSCSR